MIKNKKTLKALGYKGLMEENIKNKITTMLLFMVKNLFQLNPFIDKIYLTLVQ